jgi:hypothetical protein
VSAEEIRVSRSWLDLREPADAAARSRDLAEDVQRSRPRSRSWVIHDLGGGTGAMGRWLAPLLAGPQRWIIHERDADLLEVAAATPPGPAADGAPVEVVTRCADITRLGYEDLAGATLITASALLDMLTEAELARIVDACTGAGCPVLIMLSVVGHVELTPDDPLDRRVASAFDAHQRRRTDRGVLLGPDAVDSAIGAFRRRGARVRVRSSPWRLGGAEAELAVAWFTGWVAAAREQEPDLRAETGAYAQRRLAQAESGRLGVIVGHADLLVLPPQDQSVSNRDDSA